MREGELDVFLYWLQVPLVIRKREYFSFGLNAGRELNTFGVWN
jgi:hypothetical protein